jgi:ribonucleoside-triphosphate reductase
MSVRRIERVRKRDGRVVPFAEDKIASAIERAARSVGLDQKFISEDLASVVSLYLERYYEKDVADSGDIRNFVEKVLLETGHPEVARSFIHRDVDPTPEVEEEEAVLFPTHDLRVDAGTRDESTVWVAERIVQALVKEAGLEPAVARTIARAVEEKIVRAGIRHISTGVIRELVDVELFERGLENALQSQTVLGVPKFDLQRWVYGDETMEPAEPGAIREEIADATMRQYALQDQFSRGVADAHLEGALHLHHVEDPLNLHWVSPPLEFIKRVGLKIDGWPQSGRPAADARTFIDQIRFLRERASEYVSEAIELNDVNVLAAPYLVDKKWPEILQEAHSLMSAARIGSLRARQGMSTSLGIQLGVPQALAMQRAIGPGGVEVGGTYQDLGSTVYGFTRALIEAWRDCAAIGDSPRLLGETTFYVNATTFQDEQYQELFREICAGVAEGRPALFVFERDDQLFSKSSRWAKAHSRQPGDEWLAQGQAVTINLTRIAYTCDEPSLDAYFAGLDQAVSLAVSAARSKSRILERRLQEEGRFGREIGWTRDGRGVFSVEDLQYPVGIVGLSECIKYLSGEELGETGDSVSLALRVLSYLFFRISEEGKLLGVNTSLEDLPSRVVCERFARMDLGRHLGARDVLPSGKDNFVYTDSFHLRPGGRWDAADRLDIESRFHTIVESGRVDIRLSNGWSGSELQELLRRAHQSNRTHQVSVGF